MVLMRQVTGFAQVIRVLLVLSHDVCVRAVVCTPEEGELEDYPERRANWPPALGSSGSTRPQRVARPCCLLE
jgi:hypothetical protein